MNLLLLSSAKKSTPASSDLTLFDWGRTFSQLSITVYSSPVQVGTDNTWKKVLVAGPSYVGLKKDGTLLGWGLSQYGLFGLNDNVLAPSLASTTSWLSISAGWTYSDGGDHFVAIKSDGTLWTWGSNTQGQLGLGDTINRLTPTQVGNRTNWISADAGYGYTVGLSGGVPYAWGNDNGAFGSGLGTTIRTSSPVLVGMPIHTAAAGQDSGGKPYYWTQIAYGASHGVAIRSDGSVWTWGANANGQLGINTAVANNTPIKPLLNNKSATMVAAAGLSTFAVLTDGTLWAWGQNTNGEMGQFSTTTANYSSPVQISLGIPLGGSYATISATYSQTIVGVLTTGALYTWGYGGSGCIGDNTVVSKSVPTNVATGIGSFKFVSGGTNSIFAIRTDGKLYGWGLNTGGELGDGTIISRSSPVALGGTASWTMVSGGIFSAAIKTDGSLWAWGLNSGGALGQNDLVNRSSPVQVKAGSSFTTVSAGRAVFINNSRTALHYIATDGSLWATGGNFWGDTWLAPSASSPVQIASGFKFKNTVAAYLGHFGQLQETNVWLYGGYLGINQAGDNDTAEFITTYLRPLGTGYTDYTKVSAGADFVLATRSTGTVHAWGASTSLGLGRNVAASASNHALGTPDNITPTGSSFTAISAGLSHGMALTTANTLAIWGSNSNGQQGNLLQGSANNVTASYNILPSSWNAIAAGASHSLGIDSVGALWGWGSNSYGQVGDASTTDRSSPSLIDAGSWNYVAAGNSFSFGRKIDYTMWGWGGSSGGQTGQNNTTSLSSPVQISSLVGLSFTAVSSKAKVVFALSSGSLLYSWGDNTTSNSLVPGNEVSLPTTIATSISDFDLNDNHIVALKSDSTLWSWGNNSAGQIGDSTIANRSSPTQVATGSWVAVAAGSSYSMALRSDRSLFAWGSGAYGFGDNTTVSKSSPVQLSGAKSWKLLAAGGAEGTTTFDGFMVGLRSDGNLYAWGRNTVGQLGDGTTVARSSPTLVATPQAVVSWTSFAVNSGSGTNQLAIALKSDGSMWAWGNPNQSGDLTSTGNTGGIFNQLGVGYKWSSIGASNASGFAIRSDGILFAWGDNTYGQIGNNSTSNVSSLTQIGNSSWKMVATGGYGSAMAIRSDGTLWSWGFNSNGVLGVGDTNSRSSPVQVGTSSWTFVTMGNGNALGIRADGTLWAWGYNASGQLGDGTTISKSSPVQIGTSSWSIVAIYNHSAGIDINGRLFTWGYNSWGQLGDNTNVAKSSPVQIGVGYSWTSVGIAFPTNAGVTTAIRSDGTMWATGNNGYYQIGSNNATSYSSPVQIGVGLSWKSVGGDIYDMLAISTTGVLYGWGNPQYAGLGQAYGAAVSSPVVVSGTSIATVNNPSSWVSLSAGRGYALALKADGSLFGWGYNLYGQLGLLSTANYSTPIQIGNSTWSAVSALNYNSFAIDTSGRLFGWGPNNSGNGTIGDNTSINRSAPVQIGIGNSWSAIASGTPINTFAAIRSDKTLWSWGSNAYGQLGSGSTDTTNIISSPVQVGTSSWSAVSTGFNHTLGLDASNRLWSWGDNTYGQLGNNSPSVLANTSNPTQFSGTQSYSVVATGLVDTHMIGLTDTNLYTVGDNSYGQVGNRTQANPFMSESAALGSGFAIVSGGNGNTFGIKSDGSLWAVGNNANAQLGHGTGISNQSSPIQIGAAWRTVSPAGIVLGIRDDYSLWVWGGGTNSVGQLGQNNTTNYGGHFLQLGLGYSWTSVAASLSNGYAIRSDGALFTWGDNSYGQLGLGDAVNRSSPTQLGTNSWTAVAATVTGPVTVHAIRSDGQLWAWGNNNTGQIGDNTSVLRSSPVLVDANNSWAMVASGTSFTHGITTTGALYGWGVNTGGQLGDNTLVNKSVPTAILAGSSFVVVSGGYQHALAIDTANRLFGWGNNTYGQLGDNTNVTKSSPTLISSAYSWVAVSTNKGVSSTSAGLISNGALFTWGESSAALLANVEPTNPPPSGSRRRSSPVLVASTSSFTFLNVGFFSAYALTPNGTLFGWGLPTNFDLGPTYNNSISPTVAIPTEIMLGKYSWNAVSAGEKHVAAIRSDGKLFQWGAFSPLGGFGFLQSSPTIQGVGLPTQVGYSWTKIASSGRVTLASPVTVLAIRSDGQLFGWGYNASGQVGVNSTSDVFYPVPVGFNGGEGRSIPWKDVSLGSNWAIGVKTDGTLWAWGANTYGQLGTADQVSRSNPTLISASSFTAIGAGSYNSYAIDVNGRLFGWGAGTYYGSGDGTNANRSSPVLVSGTSSYTMVTAGQHTLALTVAKTIMAWGYNGYGQIGNNSITNALSPTLVTTNVGSAVMVVANIFTSAAISTTGKLYLWGYNGYGQVGDTTALNRSVPTLLGGTNSWTAVSVGYATNYAQTTTGLLYFWGQNAPYLSANSSFANAAYSSPVLISSDSSWSVLPVGGPNLASYQPGQTTALAVKDGALWTWGMGNLGMGNNPMSGSINSPVVAMAGDWSWTAVASGVSHVALIRAGTGTVYTYGLNKYGQLGLNMPVGFTTLQPSPTKLSNAQSISASDAATYAVDNNGTLYSWGANFNAQLGTTSGTHATTPTAGVAGTYTKVYGGLNFGVATNTTALTTWGITPVAPSSPRSTWSMIVMSASNNCGGIRNDGSMWAWSSVNTNGNLGNNSTVAITSSYVQVGAGYSWKVMAATNFAFAAIRSDGTLWSWGSNTYGELGQGDVISRSVPTQVGKNSSWTFVTGSVSGACFMGIASGGNLYAWGQNSSNGILGDLTVSNNRSSPVLIGTSFSAVSVGQSHALAIGGGSNNYLYGWGYNGTYAIGVGGITNYSAPTLVNTANAPWNKVMAGTLASMAITNSNNLFTWGSPQNGQLGNNSTTANISTPAVLASASYGWLGQNGTGAYTATSDSSTLYTWGSATTLGDFNNNAQIYSRSSPTIVSASLGLRYFFDSGTVMGGIDANGNAYIWGSVTAGQYPYLSAIVSHPTVMATDNRVSTSTIVVSGLTPPSNTYPNASHFAYLSNNVLYRWGSNTSGQQGLPYNNFVPNLISSSSWLSISAGISYSLAGRSDGLYAWGANNGGKLGDNTTINRSAPTLIAGGNFPIVAANINNSGAIDSYGTLFTWGVNNRGSTGASDTISRSSPYIVDVGNVPWTNIYAGVNHYGARTPAGNIYMWGSNTSYQLGLGTTDNKSQPSQIAGTWISVDLGNAHSLGIDQSSKLWVWGKNTTGQLGTNNTSPYIVPTNYDTVNTWNVVAAGFNSSAGIRSDKSLWTWGDNSNAALGQNSVGGATSSPVQIGVGSSYSFVALNALGNSGSTLKIS